MNELGQTHENSDDLTMEINQSRVDFDQFQNNTNSNNNDNDRTRKRRMPSLTSTKGINHINSSFVSGQRGGDIVDGAVCTNSIHGNTDDIVTTNSRFTKITKRFDENGNEIIDNNDNNNNNDNDNNNNNDL